MEPNERGLVMPDHNGIRVITIMYTLKEPAELSTIAELFPAPGLGYPQAPENLEEILEQLTVGKWLVKEGDAYQISPDMTSFLLFVNHIGRRQEEWEAEQRQLHLADQRRIIARRRV